MPLTPRQRKAAFVAKAIENDLTLEQAARSAVDVGWHHLNEGLLGMRPLSADVQKKVAAYLGVPIGRLFPMGRREGAAV